ncbi:MAG: alkaline phosphatase family protein [Acidobacteriota bacterium]|nr:alkaline phosphatase family protein [Acidobacteriota bacterium]
MQPRLTLVLATILCAASLAAQTPPAHPDLVVVISIDQFPYSYITRFQPYFAPDGFNRVLQRGANFTHSLYPYSVTFTGPGHAAIGTGYVPARSGIVANNWFDRTTGTPEYCVADERVKGGFSPLNLASDSLGDRLQEHYDKSKVYGISLKDRAAILMAGRKANAAYWFDPSLPGFVSSAYYRLDKPLVESFNATVLPFVAAHTAWEQSNYIPPDDLARITHDPPQLRKFKSEKFGMDVKFPHPIRNAEALIYTPYGNQLVLQFAERLIDAENLGTDDGNPDLVFVSLSSPDYLGHSFGPESLEAADTVVRTDRDLENFFHDLDAKFGSRWTFAITADHGVQSIPEVAKDMGRTAGRVDMRNPGKTAKTFADLAPQRKALEKSVAKKLGVRVSDATSVGNGFIVYFDEPALYLNWTRVRELKLDGERVKRAMREAAREIDGVSAAFTNSELLLPHPDASPLEAAVRLSFRADRSGDVLLTLKPGYIWNYSDPPTGTTHGQPVEADQHVPLMLWGTGIRTGSFDDAVAPTFLAKTLGRLLGVDAGGAETHVLPCI